MFFIFLGKDPLRKGLEAWVREMRPTNTSKTYAPYAKKYLAFCADRGLSPKSDSSLSAFMFHGFKSKGLGRVTLTNTIPSAVADIFRFDNAHKPTDSGLVREMKKVITRMTPPSRGKLPVLVQHLKEMVALAKPNEESIRNMFMMILMFMGFLRESELAGLKACDLWVENLQGKEVLFIFVEMKKNDQERHGHTIVLGSQPDSPLCPVTWYRAHLMVRRSSTHAFHHVWKSPKNLACDYPNTVLKRMVKSVGLDPALYGSHSLRRGGASAAANAGVASHVIARHGDWKSDAVFLYITDALANKLAVGDAILNA